MGNFTTKGDSRDKNRSSVMFPTFFLWVKTYDLLIQKYSNNHLHSSQTMIAKHS